MKLSFLLRSLLISGVLSIAVFVPDIRSSFSENISFYFEVMLQSSANGVAQLFFDKGQGIREEDSIRVGLTKGNEPQLFRFPLSPGNYRALRFDPIDREASMVISEPRIVDSTGHIAEVFTVSDLLPVQQISEMKAVGNMIAITTTTGAYDPILSIRLDRPLQLQLQKRIWMAVSMTAKKMIPHVALVMLACLSVIAAVHAGIYCLTPLVIWLFYLIVFFPGLMNADSLGVWASATHSRFADSHTGLLPITYSWLIKIWNSPAIIGISQILALIAVFWYSIRTLISIKTPRWALVLITGCFAFSPMIGANLITLIKDVPFGILTLLLFSFSIRIVESEGIWLYKRLNAIAIIVVLALLFIARHDGIVPYCAFFCISFLFYQKHWKRITSIAVLSICCVVLIKGPIYAIYKVNRDADVHIVHLQCAHIADVYNMNGVITPDQMNFISEIAPPDAWRYHYHPYNSTFVYFFNPNFNLGFAYEHRQKLNRAWFEIVTKNWMILLKDRVKKGSAFWSIVEPSKGYTYAVHVQAVPEGIDPNTSGLHLSHPVPILEHYLRGIINTTSKPSLNWFFYRPALYIYLCIFLCMLLLFIAKRREVVVLVAPPLVHSFMMALIVESQDSRYFFYIFLIAPVMVGYTAAVLRKSR